MNVLIINGHPRRGSFSEAIARAYADGATDAGVNVKMLTVHELDFNPNVITPSPRQQLHEKDILIAQQLITEADHLVFIYPTWWGTMPALMKGFLDRVFTPGFAFEEIEGGVTGYEKLLKGKSADIITTLDTPLLINRLVNKSPGNNAMKKATLQFCGIQPVNVTNFSPLKKAAPEKRLAWLEEVRKKGLKLREGRISIRQRVAIKAAAWLKAIRLQFYPMTLIAYATGAFAASSMDYGFNRSIFWVGFFWLFLIEVATVFGNDYFDYRSDEQNRFFSPFNGGSRVIVEKDISFPELRKGIVLALLFSVLVLTALTSMVSTPLTVLLPVCMIVYIAAIGYTAPPLKLSYRGLGELDVSFTHSLAVIICGYIFQGGKLEDTIPWLISLPLFIAVLPSIILAGLPDRDADQAAGKRTLAVRLGKRRAAKLAFALTVLAALLIILFKETNIAGSAYNNLVYFVIPHAAWLCFKLANYIKEPSPAPRIDSLMVASLTYLVWFGLIPLINLS